MKFNCEICGKEFESSKWYARTCSDRCRMALSRKERGATQPGTKPIPRRDKPLKEPRKGAVSTVTGERFRVFIGDAPADILDQDALQLLDADWPAPR
jgi:hypothetical protein